MRAKLYHMVQLASLSLLWRSRCHHDRSSRIIAVPNGMFVTFRKDLIFCEFYFNFDSAFCEVGGYIVKEF